MVGVHTNYDSDPDENPENDYYDCQGNRLDRVEADGVTEMPFNERVDLTRDLLYEPRFEVYDSFGDYCVMNTCEDCFRFDPPELNTCEAI